jgi:hypothetical protein
VKLLAVAVAATISIGLAAPAHAVSDQQIRYMSDVDQHGGLTADQSYAPGGQTLSDAVCADVHKGNAAANEVIGVANDVTSLHGSMAKAEVAVYWAITDLCRDQMSQRQDHWRDGQ